MIGTWVEAVYSCLGWAAKLAVFSTEYVYLKDNKIETAELNSVAIGFGTFALVATALTVVSKPSAPKRITQFFVKYI